MAKSLFRAEEIARDPSVVVINSPYSFPELAYLLEEEKETEDPQAVEEYQGPTVADLKKEAEAFQAQWEVEKELLINAAKAEADNIINQAKETAFQEVQRKTNEAQARRQAAADEAARILGEAQKKADELTQSSQTIFEQERKETRNQASIEGRDAGFAEGKAESDRLIARMHTVLERVQDQREAVLAETEQQIIDLVLLISRKVIKVISENQHDIIISNVVEALRKVKSRGTVTIRVNVADLKMTTEHTKEFISQVEGLKDIQVLEDSLMDPGGCVIETDFGEVDARISSQLAELESRILEISPIIAKSSLEKGQKN
ncbi:flagellar assembly protein FliH [Spirochaetia bacterium]|nr:flagellar assembly protein FliH [Spirochaetia bacterium]GHU35495.1 flagellar assembly protein FliH [Spirochaetia bacterium]